jgi:uracil-DNA glycosylase family 4
MSGELAILADEITACSRCPRLLRHSKQVALMKRRAYVNWDYWGKPIPSFGDPKARVLVVGLAPAAHGANRTGRMFTGDKSGDFLYRALYETGFASQPESSSRQDGLTLHGVYITAAVHCAPPYNKPTPDEFHKCRPYLEREIDLLSQVRVVVALGKLAFDTYLSILKDREVIKSRTPFVFGHNREFDLIPKLVSSYHPSQQNTSTGKLTSKMLREVFERARSLAG